jgi:hypothetical protein
MELALWIARVAAMMDARWTVIASGINLRQGLWRAPDADAGEISRRFAAIEKPIGEICRKCVLGML